MTQEKKKELIDGNILLSRYVFGEPKVSGYYQVGYKKGKYPWLRAYNELFDDGYNNFHNDWNLLMQVIANIAKDEVAHFSTEEKMMDDMATYMFEFSYDQRLTWSVAINYVKLKLTV